jgi:hypothetical protein
MHCIATNETQITQSNLVVGCKVNLMTQETKNWLESLANKVAEITLQTHKKVDGIL